MQLVMLCGGTGRRLRPYYPGPKSLVPVGNATLLARLLDTFLTYHRSAKPPIAIVDERDALTPAAITARLPRARIVRQPRPDGVANALLLAEPFMDDLVLAVLGDLVLNGRFCDLPDSPALTVWTGATAAETRKNFGVATAGDLVHQVIEKPTNVAGWRCGIGAYVLDRRVLGCFRLAPIDAVTGERGITSGIQAAIDAGVSFRVVEFSGYYNNVNEPTDVDEVERHLAMSMGSPC